MKIYIKRSVLFTILILTAIPTVAYTMINSDRKNVTYGYYQVLWSDNEVCTTDVPISSCGPYFVTAKSSDGTERRFKVAGYDENGGRDKYESISLVIRSAVMKDQLIELKIEDEYISSAKL